MNDLRGKTLLMSGGSRGIGLAIAERAARDGANVAIIAKTTTPHPKLEGTIFTAAERIEAAGGTALPIAGDVRDEESVTAAVERTVKRFGGVDIVVNNASAIDLGTPESIAMKRYDLMQDINVRGAFLLSRSCLPSLRESENPHVLTLSPPLSLRSKWYREHLAYTIAKHGMSMVTLGMADAHREEGIAFNSLWPRTYIATAAVRNRLGGEDVVRRSRNPQIMADAAYSIFRRPSRSFTGNFCIDEAVLREEGETNFARYSVDPRVEPLTDIFVDEDVAASATEPHTAGVNG